MFKRLPLAWVERLPFFVAFERDPSDSGKIHSDTRSRWLREDPEVGAAAEEGATLMNTSFLDATEM